MMGFQSPIRLRPLVLFAALLPLVESEQLRAGGKNGVAPNTVSLPSGPGSIEGLGESFEPMLQTGTAKYEVPIALPPGVAGHTPSLSLNYDAGFANGPAGFGWTFGPGAIKRQSERGVPRYREPEEDDTFLGPSGMDLVELQNGFFLSRIEGNFLRYGRVWPERTEHPERFYWEVHSKDGTKYEYGLTDAGRVAQPAAESPTSRERIYAWLLERSTDVHGNVIEYRYDDQGWQEDRGKYLIEVRYGPGPPPWGAYYFVVFEYEDRPDWFTDARSGFLVKIRKRLTRIHVAIQGAPEEATRNCKAGDFNRDGTSDRLIRSYELLYTVSNGGQVLAGHSHWTLLSQITVVGSDGESSLPPLVLRYGLSDENFFEEKELDAAGGLIYSKGEPLIVNDRRNVELLDVNSDGLPDLIHTEADEHFAYLNRGVREFAVAAAAVVCPPPGPRRLRFSDRVDPELLDPGASGALSFRLEEPNVHLADMNADGLSDLVVTEGDGVKYYPNRGRLEVPEAAGAQGKARALWGERLEMATEGDLPPPPFGFVGQSPARTIDLNFDKLTDVVVTSENSYTAWYNRGGGKYSRGIPACGAIGPGGDLLQFSDPRVKLADMNGDRLLDVARIEGLRIVYAASLGWGEFTKAVEIFIPAGVELSDDQTARASLIDVNGDGLSDLVVERAQGSALWLWLNLGTNALSARRVVTGLHEVGPQAKVDWADMNGNGTTDLVYADSNECDGYRLRVVDLGLILDGATHPRVLQLVDNGLGLRTEVFYRPSSDYYVEALENGNRWAIANPFAVTVISRVVTSTGLDLDGVPGIDISRREFVYRDGYYDPVRRQFCGFAFVKRITQGDSPGTGENVSGPTLVERFCFHTGAPDGVDNDGDGFIDEVNALIGREEEPLKGVQLWKESASLPDDPRLDGAYADDAVVFERTVSGLESWEVSDLCTQGGGRLAVLLGEGYRTKEAGRSIRLAVRKEEDRYLFERKPGLAKHLRMTMDVDALGERAFERDYGEYGVDGPTDDDRFTSYEYARNESVWIMSAVSRIAVRAVDDRGAFVSDTRNYYDGAPFVGLPLGQVGSRGLHGRAEAFISEPSDWTPRGEPLPSISENSAAIGDPRQPGASVNVQRSEYDAYGNVITLLDGNGSRREMAYDPTFHTYPVRETISTGKLGGPLVVEVEYHLGFGSVVRSLDFNRNATTYDYDVLGRPTAVTRPIDLLTHPTLTYSYALANPRALPGVRPRQGEPPLIEATPLYYAYDSRGTLTLTPMPVNKANSDGVPRIDGQAASSAWDEE